MKVKLNTPPEDVIFQAENERDLFLLGKISGRIPKTHCYNENGNPARAVVEVPVEELLNFLTK